MSAATPTDGTAPDRRPTGGTVVPSGASVWDAAPVPAAASTPAAGGAVPTEQRPAAPRYDDDQRLPTRATPPTGPERVTTSDAGGQLSDDGPSGPRPDPARRRTAAGLAGVVALAVAVIGGAAWFVSGDADGAGGAAAATTVAVEAPSLAALERFTSPTPDSAGAPPATTVAVPPTMAPEPVVTAPEPVTSVVSADDPSGDPASHVDTPDSEPEADPDPELVPGHDTELAPDPEPGLAAAAAPTAPAAPWVEISSRVEACKFASSCLVVGYAAHGFAGTPDEFVCEFGSGERFTFRATVATVDYACATGTRGNSITIEIAGVRSDTVTFD